MPAALTPTPRDRLRHQLADLTMPGALEALDDILRRADGGQLPAGEAIGELLGSQIALRNQRRLQTAMRSARLPAVKTLGDFDFTFQPSVKRDQLESLHTLSFIERRENVVFLGPPTRGEDPHGHQPRHCRGPERATGLVRDPGRLDHLARGGEPGQTPQPEPIDWCTPLPHRQHPRQQLSHAAGGPGVLTGSPPRATCSPAVDTVPLA